MATAKKTEQAAAAANQSPATDATPKPKRENLFSSGISADFRKKESKLRFGFNIIGNKIKKLGLSPESTSQMIAILQKEFETKSAELLKPSADANGAAQESFV